MQPSGTGKDDAWLRKAAKVLQLILFTCFRVDGLVSAWIVGDFLPQILASRVFFTNLFLFLLNV